MSWLVGFAGHAPTANLAEAHYTPLYGVRESGIYAQAGGLQLTSAGGTLTHGGSFLVTGLGAANGTVLTKSDWAERLNPARPQLQDLDGHFVAFRWRSGIAELFTDPLGIRTVHLMPWQNGTLFGTRLDWLTRIAGGLEIDFATFGAQWLLANQLTTASQVKGTIRLGPGGHARISQGQIRVTGNQWSTEISSTDSDGHAFAHALSQALRWKGPVNWSLGLSGGLDSRLLLALHSPASTHVWGPADHPDVKISRRIGDSERLLQHYFMTRVPQIDECLALLRKRITLTQVISPASSVVSLMHYSRLHALGFGIVDGGFGEVARRQFMNRMLVRRAFRRPPARVMPHLFFSRASVFTPELNEIMLDGTLQQIEGQWAERPSEADPANATDLLGVRSRLPNFFGLEQNQLDGEAACYMPFAQPSVLKALFNVPVKLRRHGILFRRLIKQQRKSLTLHPLVKGPVIYPYGLGTYGAQTYSVIKKQVRRVYEDPRPHRFLHTMKPFVLDLTGSADVVSYAAYARGSVRTLAETYYGGDLRQATKLDWWLTFELWRQMLRGKF